MAADEAMRGKVAFDEIYDQPDPRAYMRTLSGLDYQIPDHARPVFARLVDELRARRDTPFSVVDVCTSYGVNPALLNHDLTLAQLYERYRSPALDGLSPAELAAADRDFYAQNRRPDAVRAVGLDAACNAVDYARSVGLLDAAGCQNLEERAPSAEVARQLSDAGLITITGGIGYIGETTVARILDAGQWRDPPWLAAFVLRWVDMVSITKVVHDRGLTMERFDGATFRQRRFASDVERDFALARLRDLGLDPQGVESDGYHHTWLYVARPHADVEAAPLPRLLGADPSP